jgi:hypothetical protein
MIFLSQTRSEVAPRRPENTFITVEKRVMTGNLPRSDLSMTSCSRPLGRVLIGSYLADTVDRSRLP